LAELEERLDLIQRLARKHRVPPAQLATHADSLTTELEGLDADLGRLERLDADATTLRERFEELAGEVSAARRHAADGFASEVSACMNTLAIRGGALGILFEPADGELGIETIEFQVTTNPKYPPGALARIASGGERARISLSIQVAAAARMALPCLVLDEADVGVGGTTADVLGRLLRDLGRHTQVLCITHAPQVAALGDHHLVVRKDADQDTTIERLDESRRLEEVARMLAGADVTDKTRAYASALLDEAHATLH
jgi:DNA repair protein RecN (Recombination protein N)